MLVVKSAFSCNIVTCIVEQTGWLDTKIIFAIARSWTDLSERCTLEKLYKVFDIKRQY